MGQGSSPRAYTTSRRGAILEAATKVIESHSSVLRVATETGELQSQERPLSPVGPPPSRTGTGIASKIPDMEELDDAVNLVHDYAACLSPAQRQKLRHVLPAD